MKGAAFALTFILGGFALCGVKADSPQKVDATTPPLSKLLKVYGLLSQFVNWDNFSPELVGIRLDHDNMTPEELDQVASAAVQLGMVEPGNKEDFIDALKHPAMRRAMQDLNNRFGDHASAIVQTEDFAKFSQQILQHFNPKALQQVLGLTVDFNSFLRQPQLLSSEVFDEEAFKEELLNNKEFKDTLKKELKGEFNPEDLEGSQPLLEQLFQKLLSGPNGQETAVDEALPEPTATDAPEY